MTLPTAEPIASPCVRRCAVSPVHGLCTGCGRTLEEIAAWSSLSRGQRAAIMATLAKRLASCRIIAPDPATS